MLNSTLTAHTTTSTPQRNPAPSGRIPRHQAPRYMGMARAIAARLSSDPRRHDDLVGEALVALVESARRFEPDRGHQLISYAWPCMTGRALDSLRRDGRLRRTRAAAALAQSAPTSPSEPLVDRAVLNMALERVHGNLLSDHRLVLKERYWAGHSLAQIARAEGWSQAKARRLHHVALGHLRRELAVKT